MNRVPLTRRQNEILAYIRDYVAQQGISPTLEEIAHAFGVSRVTIFGHVGELEDKGFLTRPTRGISRGIILTKDQVDSAPASPQTASRAVPILGAIAAGQPISVVESSESFSFDDLLPPQAEVFILRVQGNSMIEDAICDGDMVLVEQRQEARNGETVVAVLPDNETTLKRFYREADRIRLQPANATMEPIYASQVQVRGVVIGVIRQVQ